MIEITFIVTNQITVFVTTMMYFSLSASTRPKVRVSCVRRRIITSVVSKLSSDASSAGSATHEASLTTHHSPSTRVASVEDSRMKQRLFTEREKDLG